MPKHVIKSTYSFHVGDFRLVSGQDSTWYSCREQFHKSVIQAKTKDFLFVHQKGEQENIIKFMEEFQERAKIKNVIEFRETTDNRVLFVSPGMFWCSQNIKLSLLTALLRCGRSYNGDNFMGALYSTIYTSSTKPAVDRFVAGYTHYLGSGSQWQSTFVVYKTKIDYCERTLVEEKDIEVSKEALAEAKHIVQISDNVKEVMIFMLAKSLDDFYKRGVESKT